MNTSEQSILHFKEFDDAEQVHLKLKPYIQPFEQLLAQGELYGLIGDSYAKYPFSKPADQQVTLAQKNLKQDLFRRLAYWEQIGNLALEPTFQILLESEKHLTDLSGQSNFKFHKSRKLRYGPHGIHEYRGKFFPQLVKALINFAGLQPGEVVIDPMCGSGTTNIEARSMGMQTIGADLNPLSVKISRVKTSVFDLDLASINTHLTRFLTAIKETDIRKSVAEYPWNKDDTTYLNRWFAPEALKELAFILTKIADTTDKKTRRFLQVCLSNIIRSISWQRESDLRVRKEITNYTPGMAIQLLSQEIKKSIAKITAYLSCFNGIKTFPQFTIQEGDARNIHTVFPTWVGKCDVLITSPPYAMALPYIDTDRLSLSTLGLLPRGSHRAREYEMIGNREISNSQRQALWENYLARRNELPKNVREVVETVDEANKRETVGFRRKNLSALLGRYFLDMSDAMQNALKMMRPGHFGFYVVGNNSTTIDGKRFEIETDKLVWEIGKKVGWKQRKMLNMELLPSRDIFRNNKGSSESILWFQASGEKLQRKAIYGATSKEIETLSNGDWDFHKENTQQHLHAIHSYPARFIPQIPNKAIRTWTNPGEVVLDPFCGCGTTLLESVILGREAIGIDNNAVACLISRAKVADYTDEDIKILTDFLSKIDEKLSTLSKPLELPEYHNVSYWFSDDALKDLGKIKAIINQLPEKPGAFAMAIFSAIIVRVSNQDSDTRYARIKKSYDQGNAIEWFKSRLVDALKRLKAIATLSKAQAVVHCIDGRDLSVIPDGSVNLIVTSPPYINAYDYHKYHRHRLHWIDGSVELARDTEIGKHDTFTRPKATPDRYFEDMQKCFAEWKRVLTPDGKAFVVIGDGIVNKTPVPVGDKFVEIMEQLGLKTADRWIRTLQKSKKSFNQHGRIDKEHVLLFEK